MKIKLTIPTHDMNRFETALLKYNMISPLHPLIAELKPALIDDDDIMTFIDVEIEISVKELPALFVLGKIYGEY